MRKKRLIEGKGWRDAFKAFKEGMRLKTYTLLRGRGEKWIAVCSYLYRIFFWGAEMFLPKNCRLGWGSNLK